MKLRATSPLLDDWTGEAEITTDHAASFFGKPVLVIHEEAIGIAEAARAGYEILDATLAELDLMHCGGYHFNVAVA